MNRNIVEQKAVEFANSTTNIRDIKCPPGVINPGLYFGFIYGYLESISGKKGSDDQKDGTDVKNPLVRKGECR